MCERGTKNGRISGRKKALGKKIFCGIIGTDSGCYRLLTITGDIHMINNITSYIEDYFIIHKYTQHEIIQALNMLKTYCDNNIRDIEMEIRGEL